jgi:hypothetical protein
MEEELCRIRYENFDYATYKTDIPFNGERRYMNNILTGIQHRCSVLGDGIKTVAQLPFLELIRIETDSSISFETLQIIGNVVLIKNTDSGDITINLGTAGVPVNYVLPSGYSQLFEYNSDGWESIPNRFHAAVFSGSVGIGTNTPTLVFSVNEKSGFTDIGGFAIKLTNRTGSDSVEGQLVKTSASYDDAVQLTGINDDECIGVFLESGVADGSEAWIVVSGIADVMLDDNVSSVHGNWMGTGQAGLARTSGSPPAAPDHFEEIGHCIETVAATGPGTFILARCVLHFN